MSSLQVLHVEAVGALIFALKRQKKIYFYYFEAFLKLLENFTKMNLHNCLHILGLSRSKITK